MAKVHFVGAGPGDPDLITVKGKDLLDRADVLIYAGSIVNRHWSTVAPRRPSSTAGACPSRRLATRSRRH
jgi:precorrin-4 methylase